MLSLKGPVARSTIRTTFVYALRILVQAGTLLLVARLLGPEDYAAFASVLALAVLLGSLSHFGSPMYLLSKASEGAATARQIMSYAVPLTLLCGGALSCFYFFIIWLFGYGADGLSGAVIGIIAFTELIVQPLIFFPTTFLLIRERVALSQFIVICPLILRLLLLVAIFFSSAPDKLLLYVSGCLAMTALVLAAVSVMLRDIWVPFSRWRLPTPAEFKATAGYSVIYLTNAAPGELDKVLVVKVLSADLAGLYAAGSRVLGALLQPILAMLVAAMPRIFRFAVEDSGKAARLLKAMFFSAVGYSFAAILFIWFVSPLLEMLFGRQYAGIGHTIRVMCVLVPFMIIRLVSCNALMSLHRPWFRALIEITGLSILMAGGLMLPVELGLFRMLYAHLAAEVVMGFLAGYAALRYIIRSAGKRMPDTG